MPSTYTPSELTGAGIPSTQVFTAATSYTLTITDKATPGSCYLVVQATNLATAPLYFSGSTFVLTNVTDVINDVQGNHFGAVIEPNGTSTIVWVPAVTISSGGVTIQATGGIGLSIA